MLAECEMSTDIVRCTILMLLYDHPCLHGYGLRALLETRLGRVISPAIIYPFLASLSKSGYASSRRDREGRRVKILYTMTPDGRRFSRRVFKRLSMIVSTAIDSSLAACANCGCKLHGPGYKGIVDGRRTTFCCVHCGAAYGKGE